MTDQEETSKEMPAFSVPLWLNPEKDDWEDAYPGYRLQIHRTPSDPQPDVPNFYEATLEAVTRVAGINWIRLTNHNRHNTDAKYTEPPEDIPLTDPSLRFFKIIGRKKKRVPVVRRGNPEGLKPTGT